MRAMLQELSRQANAFFDEAQRAMEDGNKTSFRTYSYDQDFWQDLPPELQTRSEVITGGLLNLCGAIADASRTALLTGDEDTRQVRLASKKFRASMHLRRFYFNEVEVIHDEGQVLGIQPASQSDGGPLAPPESKSIFNEYAAVVAQVLSLIESSASTNAGVTGQASSRSSTTAQSIRTGTAFLMMCMDPAQKEFVDVLDAVKRVFSRFGFHAKRADDIEHEGLITERVLNEIRTSEILFADLTGTRPNVYYEVGFAHALRKRVVLFRKAGTGVHFDLAGYNCPEYENLRDLSEKLTKRLTELTNTKPRSDPES